MIFNYGVPGAVRITMYQYLDGVVKNAPESVPILQDLMRKVAMLSAFNTMKVIPYSNAISQVFYDACKE